MQMSDAMAKQREWEGRECDHPDFEKEYFNGAQTGDKVCIQCGEVLSDEEIEEIKAKRSR